MESPDLVMDHTELLAKSYNASAHHYRNLDEVHLSGKDYRMVSRCLYEIASKFNHEISVLDLGCGTGRYFHCLQNAKKIIGVDVSEGMLEAARNPVCKEKVSAMLELVRGDIFSVNLPPKSFDLIYSVGVFGNGCGVTKAMASRLAHWIKPGGYVFFDAFDAGGFPLPLRYRKQVKALLYSGLPRFAQALWNKWSGWPPFFLTEGHKLYSVMTLAGFREVKITMVHSETQSGAARKLQCVARVQSDF